ncbi:MAG: hypothetical protein J5825_07075 [Lachnospiraceae bacterium]|nr:hypothetical protein [Lachnospiraceae bacterium]
MISLTVSSVPVFTKALFVGNVFDQFLLSEAVFATTASFTIDTTDIPSSGEEEPDEIIRNWGLYRHIAFEIIRGKKLPRSFRITLAASPEMLSEITETENGFFKENPELIDALTMNIYYKDQKIRITTSTSLKVFSMEQNRLDHIWDQYVSAFLELNEIDFEDDLM